MALRILQHLEQHAELNPIGVRLDLAWLRRELMIGARVFFRFPFRRMIDQFDVGIGDRGLFQPFIDRCTPLLILPFHFQRDLRAAWLFPINLLIFMNQRLILFRIDLDFKEMRGSLRSDAGNNLDRFAGRQLPIHAGCGNSDALLPTAHPQAMKL